MLKQANISSRQFMILVLLFTIGNTFIDQPGEITIKAGKDAWIAILIGTLFAVGLMWFWGVFQKRFGSLNLIEVNEFVLGKCLGKVVSVIFFLYFFMNFLYTIFTFSSFVTRNLLPGMNTVLLGSVFALVVLSTVRKGLGNIARVAELLFPLIILLLLSLFVLVLTKANLNFLQPMLSNGVAPIQRGVFDVLGSPFLELITLMVIFGAVKEDNMRNRSFYKGILLGGLILATLTLLCIVVLGAGQVKQIVYPSFSLAQTIHLGEFLNRQESIVSISWLISQVIYGALSFYAASYTLAKITNLQTLRPVTFPLALVALAYAPFLIERPMLTDTSFWYPYSFFTAVCIPFVIWVIALIKRKKINSE